MINDIKCNIKEFTHISHKAYYLQRVDFLKAIESKIIQIANLKLQNEQNLIFKMKMKESRNYRCRYGRY